MNFERILENMVWLLLILLLFELKVFQLEARFMTIGEILMVSLMWALAVVMFTIIINRPID